MFGIENYSPRWLNGIAGIRATHAQRLRTLIGRPLTRLWLVWDTQDDEWFSDCPVLLDFDGEQVEINHYKFHDLSITWNSVDPEFLCSGRPSLHNGVTTRPHRRPSSSDSPSRTSSSWTGKAPTWPREWSPSASSSRPAA